MDQESSERINQLWSRPGDQHGTVTRELAFETLKFNINSRMYTDVVTKTLDGIRFTDLWGSGYSVEKTKFLSKKDYGQSLKQLKSNLLILHGENDLVFPVEMAEQLHQLVPGSHIHILQNAGHLAHIEANEDWTAKINLFLNQ